jgi:hypothetical protein
MLFAFAKANAQSDSLKTYTFSDYVLKGYQVRNIDSVTVDLPEVRGLELSYSYGTILQHNPDISHLITEHPVALMGYYNHQTRGEKEWEARYNYPDWGVGFAYQDMRNFYLGEAYSAYAFYNFYFFDRWLQVKVGQGMAYMTKPFDPVDNFRNNAYGSRLTSSTLLGLHLRRENIWKGLGIHAGATIIHYSNANVRAPNNSTNTLLFSAGLNYRIDQVEDIRRIKWERRPYREPLAYNVVARLGWNESDIRGSGQFKFYNFSFYADKRINVKSSIQLGTEVIISEFLKEYRDFFANSRPDDGITGDEPYQRVGVFVGHELHLGKTSLLTQLGYYVYWPIPFESRIYNRIGLQRRFLEDYFVSVTVRSHAASAEGVSLGIGYRFD